METTGNEYGTSKSVLFYETTTLSLLSVEQRRAINKR